MTQSNLQTSGKFNHDWHGIALNEPISFSLEIKQKESLKYLLSLSYKTSFSPNIHPKAEPGAFLEGLWDYDVLEIFFKTGTNSYLELHLAMNGAWWAMNFNSERNRSEKPASATQNKQTYWQKDSEYGCSADFEINEEIYFNNYFTGNICGIFGKDSNRKYFSLHELKQKTEPDFHKQELFKLLK